MFYKDIDCDSLEYQTDEPQKDLVVKCSNVLTALVTFKVTFQLLVCALCAALHMNGIKVLYNTD